MSVACCRVLLGKLHFKCVLCIYMLFLQVVFSTAIVGTTDEKLPNVPSNGCASTTHCHADYINRRIGTTVKVQYNDEAGTTRSLLHFNARTPLLTAREFLVEMGIEDNDPRYRSLLWEFIDGVTWCSINFPPCSIFVHTMFV